jgi:LPXTG-motif cell wall-anchored protein
MKIALNIIGGLLVMAGLVWFLQGINVLPGSYMTGNPQWAVYGGIAFIIGAGLLLFANRKKKGK